MAEGLGVLWPLINWTVIKHRHCPPTRSCLIHVLVPAVLGGLLLMLAGCSGGRCGENDDDTAATRQTSTPTSPATTSPSPGRTALTSAPVAATTPPSGS